MKIESAIISRIEPPSQSETWRQALRASVKDPEKLLAELGLDPSLLAGARRAGRLFPLRVPRSFLARMQHGNPHDPLLRQVLPLEAETRGGEGFLEDPVGDGQARTGTGVLHKYRGRVLLIATGACAVNCRYCFRRHFPYSENTAARADWRGALDYIRRHPDVHEVILSGGDPLLLDTAKLARLTERLATIPHVRRLRIHSRLPVVLPERVDRALCDWLDGMALQTVMVIHSNHPNELDTGVARRLAELRGTGTVLLNQAVLLKGVNDDAGVLEALGESLFNAGVLPYYLHLLDRVKGAAHFDVPEARARSIYRELRSRASGYLVPRLVREIPGAPYKTPIL